MFECIIINDSPIISVKQSILAEEVSPLRPYCRMKMKQRSRVHPEKLMDVLG